MILLVRDGAVRLRACADRRVTYVSTEGTKANQSPGESLRGKLTLAYWRGHLELARIGWQRFAFDLATRDQTAALPSFDIFATRLSAQPLRGLSVRTLIPLTENFQIRIVDMRRRWTHTGGTEKAMRGMEEAMTAHS